MIVCDFHVHLGRSRDGASLTAAELIRLMRASGVKRAVIFPVDEKDVGLTYEKQNRFIFKLAEKHKALIPFCRLDPRSGKKSRVELETFRRMGFRGLKLHPRSEKFWPSKAAPLLARANAWGWPVVLHSSHEMRCKPSQWESTIARFPRVKFILAHGGKDSYLEAVAVAKRQPNVWIDTSTLSYGRTKTFLKELGARRILFASDQPYSHMALEKKKFELIASKSQLRTLFCQNAVDFFPELRRV